MEFKAKEGCALTPILYLVIPCYNEEAVLPITAPQFRDKLAGLISAGEISKESRVLFVNDGSRDSTWEIIKNLSAEDPIFCGISLSRNMGHQNALLAGLMEAKNRCDVTVSIDCDGQDDINAVDLMLTEFKSGCDVVYGVRDSRKNDSFFKRNSAQLFYKTLNLLGAETVYNHADYRLLSKKAVEALSKFKEVNIYLRGMVPMVGFKSTCVYYDRKSRQAGKSHYPLGKMLNLAISGITNLSTKPIRMITVFGFLVTLLSLAGIIWSVISYFLSSTVAGWASIVAIVCFFGGAQLFSLGVIGEYIGKLYMEAKGRPRFIISEKTDGEM